MMETKIVLETISKMYKDFPQEVLDGILDGSWEVDFMWGWDNDLDFVKNNCKIIITAKKVK